MEEIQYQLIINITALEYDEYFNAALDYYPYFDVSRVNVETRLQPYGDIDYNKRVLLLKELDHYDAIIQEILQGEKEDIVLPLGEYKVEMNTSWDENTKKKALYDLIDQIDPTAKHKILNKVLLVPAPYEFRIKVEFKISFLSDSVNIDWCFIKEDDIIAKIIFDSEKAIIKIADNIIKEYRGKFQNLSLVYPKFIGKTKIISTFIESQWSYDQMKSEIEETLNSCYFDHNLFALQDKEFEEEQKKLGYKLDWGVEDNLELDKIKLIDYVGRVNPLSDEAFEDWVYNWEVKDGKRKEKNNEFTTYLKDQFDKTGYFDLTEDEKDQLHNKEFERIGLNWRWINGKLIQNPEKNNDNE